MVCLESWGIFHSTLSGCTFYVAPFRGPGREKQLAQTVTYVWKLWAKTRDVWLSLPSGVLARKEHASLFYRRLGSLPVSLFAQSIRPASQIKPFIQQGNELMEQAIRRFARAGRRRGRSAISRFSVTDWGVPKSLPVLTGHTAAERWPKYCLLICQSQDSVIRSGRIKWFSIVNVVWSN